MNDEFTIKSVITVILFNFKVIIVIVINKVEDFIIEVLLSEVKIFKIIYFITIIIVLITIIIIIAVILEKLYFFF